MAEKKTTKKKEEAISEPKASDTISVSKTELEELMNRIHRLENKGALRVEQSTLKPIVNVRTFNGLPVVAMSNMTANINKKNDRGVRTTDQRLMIHVLQEDDSTEEVEIYYEDFIHLPSVKAEVASSEGRDLHVRLDSGREFTINLNYVNA